MLPARAEPGFQLSASVGLGEFTAGAGPARFAFVPTGSFLLLLGERWLLRCDDAVTLLGATGGGFGAANATKETASSTNTAIPANKHATGILTRYRSGNPAKSI